MEPLIRLDRVSKSYSEGAEIRHVLREASVSFPEGEIVAIRGRSGSGKSTLLNLVAGIDSPTAGEVWVAGTCLSALSPARRTLFRRDHLGFVFQFFNLIPTLSVLENVQLPAELRGVPLDEAAEMARTVREGPLWWILVVACLWGGVGLASTVVVQSPGIDRLSCP